MDENIEILDIGLYYKCTVVSKYEIQYTTLRY